MCLSDTTKLFIKYNTCSKCQRIKTAYTPYNLKVGDNYSRPGTIRGAMISVIVRQLFTN